MAQMFSQMAQILSMSYILAKAGLKLFYLNTRGANVFHKGRKYLLVLCLG